MSKNQNVRIKKEFCKFEKNGNVWKTPPQKGGVDDKNWFRYYS